MPRKPKQYSQESYDHYSRYILSSIREGGSKPSSLSRDVTELLALGAVIEPTRQGQASRRHSVPEEWAPRRIKMMPRSDSDRTVKISNADSLSSPAPGLDGCPVKSRSDESISSANADGISLHSVDDLDLVFHDIDSSLDGEDLNTLFSGDSKSNQSEDVLSCSMSDVATTFNRMSTGELNLSCMNESQNCRSSRNSKNWMLGGSKGEEVHTCVGMFEPSMFDSSEDDKSSCNSAISGFSKESYVDVELTGAGNNTTLGTRYFMSSFPRRGSGKRSRANSRDSFVDSSVSMAFSLLLGIEESLLELDLGKVDSLLFSSEEKFKC